MADITAKTIEIPRNAPSLEEFWMVFTQSQALWEKRWQEEQERLAQEEKRWQERLAQEEKWRQERQEMERRADARIAKTEKSIERVSKNIGGLGNSVGKMVEAMFAPRMWKKFNARGFKFTKGGRLDFCEDKDPLAEVDFFMENGEYAMPVEIKTVLSVEDVDIHLERMGRLRQFMDKRGDRRKLVGAVAGGVVPENVLVYAQRKGFFVLLQTGDSAAIAETPEGFKPREW